jgi:hypothetical protein
MHPRDTNGNSHGSMNASTSWTLRRRILCRLRGAVRRRRAAISRLSRNRMVEGVWKEPSIGLSMWRDVLARPTGVKIGWKSSSPLADRVQARTKWGIYRSDQIGKLSGEDVVFGRDTTDRLKHPSSETPQIGWLEHPSSSLRSSATLSWVYRRLDSRSSLDLNRQSRRRVGAI